MPDVAFANIVDNLNLAPFVPVVLNSLMMIATRGYDFFVGNGDGIIKNNESIKKILDCIFIVLAIDRSGMGTFCCRWNCRRNCDCWILGISK